MKVYVLLGLAGLTVGLLHGPSISLATCVTGCNSKYYWFTEDPFETYCFYYSEDQAQYGKVSSDMGVVGPYPEYRLSVFRIPSVHCIAPCAGSGFDMREALGSSYNWSFTYFIGYQDKAVCMILE